VQPIIQIMKTIGALLALILTITISPAQTDAQASNEMQSSTNSPVAGSRSVNLDAAIKMYGLLKGRTVLQHPQLRNAKVSLTNAKTKEGTIEALEAMFREQKIAIIPDGEHFVMIVPFAFTNTVTPKAPTVANANALLPANSINFQSAPIGLVIQTCADFHRKEISDIPASMNQNRIPGNLTITFVQTTPLSREETGYALETLLAWSNIRLVPDGLKNVKLETIHK
jgi:hypothetical protein